MDASTRVAAWSENPSMLFRFFDIVKVPPARQIVKRWPGGWGVVMDDVVSGVYACVVMQIAMRIAPGALGLP